MCFSFVGHVNKEYRVESCLLSTDAHVVSGSEDGNVYVWDLIEVTLCSFENYSN